MHVALIPIFFSRHKY